MWRFPATGAGENDAKAEMVVSDSMEDWFPHISPDGKKLVYIAYPEAPRRMTRVMFTPS